MYQPNLMISGWFGSDYKDYHKRDTSTTQFMGKVTLLEMRTIELTLCETLKVESYLKSLSY
jgi:hypothetical protein